MLKVTRNGDLYFHIGKDAFYFEINSSSTNNTFVLYFQLFFFGFHIDIGEGFYSFIKLFDRVFCLDKVEEELEFRKDTNFMDHTYIDVNEFPLDFSSIIVEFKNELDQSKVGEKYGAIEGKHDDMVMSTAIGFSGIRSYK